MRRVNLQSRLAQSRLVRVATSRWTQSRIQTQATNILLNLQYKQVEPPDIPDYDIWNARDDSDVPGAVRDVQRDCANMCMKALWMATVSASIHFTFDDGRHMNLLVQRRIQS